METEQTNTEETTGDTNAMLTVNDVILMYNIISTVSRRGGFEAAEFQVVGALHEKLRSFLPEPSTAEPAETTNTGADTDVPSNQLNFDFGADKEQDASQD